MDRDGSAASPPALHLVAEDAGAPGNLRVAIVDGDTSFRRVFLRRVERAGWQYRLLAGDVTPQRLRALKLHALLLDPGALEDDPWRFLARVAAELPSLGLIVVSAESRTADRVRALRLGVDDWIAKPAHAEEVMARVEAVVRRSRPKRARPGSLSAGQLEFAPAHTRPSSTTRAWI